MFIGILLAMASFVVSYSTAQSVSCASLQTSTVIRTFEVSEYVCAAVCQGCVASVLVVLPDCHIERCYRQHIKYV